MIIEKYDHDVLQSQTYSADIDNQFWQFYGGWLYFYYNLYYNVYIKTKLNK